MFFPSGRGGGGSFFETLYENAAGRFILKWFVGLVVAFSFMSVGVRAVFYKAAIFSPGRYSGGMEVEGTDAILMGAAYISIAIFLNSYFFLADYPRAEPVHVLGSKIGGAGFAICMIIFVFRVLMKG